MTLFWPPTYDMSQPVSIEINSSIVVPDSKADGKITMGAFGESLVESLYLRAGWRIVQKNYRTRGTEIDLAVAHIPTNQGRIIEIKTRKLGVLNLASAENLLPQRKVIALKRGAIKIRQMFLEDGLDLDWSVDLVFITKGRLPATLNVTTWVNAFEL